MKKRLTILALGATVVGGATFAADAKINPYTEDAQKYELSLEQTVAGSGGAKIELQKDEAKVVLGKWNDEVKMGISYPAINASGSRAFLTDKVEWKGEKEEMHAYPLEAQAGMEDGGFEIEVVLSEKPDKNTFDFAIDGAQDLDFFYQGELTPEAVAEGAIRPENVTGSYAVYHKTKANHKVGEVNYATGKAYHIYRPKAVDAKGNEVWASLSYENGTLRVEVPKNFLEDAVYPVKVDPTFGYTTIGANSISIINSIRGSWYTISQAGTVTQMSAYIDNALATKTSKTALYAYTSTSDAGAIVQSSDQITVPVANGWDDYPFTTQPLLTAATNYFLVAWANAGGSGTLVMHYDDTVTSDGIRDNALYGTFPSPFAEDATAAGVTYSIYATYTASGVASTANPRLSCKAGKCTFKGKSIKIK